jgi:hypothetical protein
MAEKDASPLDQYQQRRDERATHRKELEQSENRATTLRGVSFLAGLAITYAAYEFAGVSYFWLLLPIAAFVAAVVWHRRLQEAIAVIRRAERYYARGLQRLNDEWSGQGPNGQRYVSPTHPYAIDLDLFGRGSMFQRLCRSVTRMGEDALSSWLLSPTEVDDLESRHQSIDELRDQLDLHESIGVLDRGVERRLDPAELRKWVAGAFRESLLSSRTRAISILLAILSLSSCVAWSMGVTDYRPFVVMLILQFGYVGIYSKHLKQMMSDAEHALPHLRHLAELLRIVESHEFSSPQLVQVANELKTNRGVASQSIERLATRLEWFEQFTRNQFLLIFGIVLMAPMFLAAAIEGWRKERSEAIPRWLDSIGVFESLLSLAVYRYERPDDILPEFTDKCPTLIAREMGHPLLPDHERVCNDVQFGEGLRLLMVSGSNMSGKSTYLRAIGSNVVLAMAGAAVVAKTFHMSPLRVASSMRIQDSLQTGTSHFYAEIKRLKLIVEWAESDQAPVLFLLDEILHGTNSHDRGVGAEAVVSKLLDCGAVGLVTTHDLALTEFIVRLSQPAKNVHFADQFVDGEMAFDYRCRDGIVEKSNAIELMRSLGLEV